MDDIERTLHPPSKTLALYQAPFELLSIITCRRPRYKAKSRQAKHAQTYGKHGKYVKSEVSYVGIAIDLLSSTCKTHTITWKGRSSYTAVD